jgi:hypothetical protein
VRFVEAREVKRKGELQVLCEYFICRSFTRRRQNHNAGFRFAGFVRLPFAPVACASIVLFFLHQPDFSDFQNAAVPTVAGLALPR